MGQAVTKLDKEYQKILRTQAVSFITENIKLGRIILEN